jgi:hypothetical protein
MPLDLDTRLGNISGLHAFDGIWNFGWRLVIGDFDIHDWETTEPEERL